MASFKNPTIFGITARNALSELALDAEESLTNLGLNPLDFNTLRNISTISSSFQMLSNSDVNTIDETSRYLSESFANASRLSDLFQITGDVELKGNLNISGRTASTSLKHYTLSNIDGDGNLVISTIGSSRVTSWEKSKINATDANDNFVGYGTEVEIASSRKFAVDPAKVITSTIKLLTPLSERIYPNTEIATNKIKVNVNGSEYYAFAMKNIPLQFDGNFSKLDSSTFRVTSTDSDIDFNILTNSGTSLTEGDGYGQFRAGDNAIGFQGQQADRTIESYLAPNKYKSLTVSNVKLKALPFVKLTALETLDISYNLFSVHPNIVKFAPNLKSFVFYRNFISPTASPEKTIESILNLVPTSIIKIDYSYSLYYLVLNFDSTNKSAFADRFPDLQEIRVNNNQFSGVTPDIGPKLTLLEIQSNKFNTAGSGTFHVPDPLGLADNVNIVKYYRLTNNGFLSDHLGYYDDTVPGYWNNNNYNNTTRDALPADSNLKDFWIGDTKLGIPNFKNSSIDYFAATSMDGYSTFENKATGEQLGDRFDDIRYQFFTSKNNIGNNNNNFKFLNCNRLTRINARDGNCFGPMPSFKGCAKLKLIEFGGYWNSSYLSEIYPSARTAMLNNNNVFVTKFTLATSLVLAAGGEYTKDVPSPLNYHEVTTYSNGDFVFEYNAIDVQWELKNTVTVSVIATADSLDTLYPWNAVWPDVDELVFSDFMTTDEDSPELEESIDLSAMPLDVFSSMTDGLNEVANPLELFAYNFDPIFFDNARTVRKTLTEIRNDFKNNLEFESTDVDGPAIFNNLYNLKRFAYESKGITEGRFPLFKINQYVGVSTVDPTYVEDETLSLGNITISNNAFTGGWGANGALKLHSDCSTALEAFYFHDNKFTGALGFKELFGGANNQTEFTKLKGIKGNNNQFTSFADADATKSPNLEKLLLSGSFTSSATAIPSFKNFTNLKVLDISNNYFESINVSDKTNLFEECSNIEELILNNNNWDEGTVVNIIRSIYNVYKAGNFKLNDAYLALRNNEETNIIKRKYIDINDMVVELKNNGHIINGVQYKVYPPAPKAPSLSIDLDTPASPRYDSSEELNQKEVFELESPSKEGGDPNLIVYRPNGIIQTNNDFEVQYFDSSDYDGLVNVRLKWDTLVNADDVTEDLDGGVLSPSEKAIVIKKEIDLNNNGSFDDSPNAAETIEIAKADIITAGGKSYYNFPIQLDDNGVANVHTPIGRSQNGTNIKFTVYGQNDRKVGGNNISSTIIITIKDSSET